VLAYLAEHGTVPKNRKKMPDPAKLYEAPPAKDEEEVVQALDDSDSFQKAKVTE